MLRIPFFRRSFSTRDAVVAALRHNSELERKVLNGRATRMSKVRGYIESASNEERDKFFQRFIELQRMFDVYATVSDRLLFSVDNNVLQDLLKHDDPKRKAAPRYHAMLALLSLAEDYYFLHLTARVSPAVLYEASGRGQHSISQTIADLTSVLADVGLNADWTFHNEAHAKRLFRLIRHDERNIAKALKEIKARSWNLKYKVDPKADGLGAVHIPLALADDMCPNVELKYFQPWWVKFILMHIIHVQMRSTSADKSAEAMMNSIRNDRDFAFLKLRGPKKDQVAGLGDIELFTECELASQTAHHVTTLSMGITFDETLARALYDRLIINGRWTAMQYGDDTDAGSKHVAYAMWHNGRETAKLNRRAEEYGQALNEFLDEVRSWLEEEPGAAS